MHFFISVLSKKKTGMNFEFHSAGSEEKSCHFSFPWNNQEYDTLSNVTQSFFEHWNSYHGNSFLDFWLNALFSWREKCLLIIFIWRSMLTASEDSPIPVCQFVGLYLIKTRHLGLYKNSFISIKKLKLSEPNFYKSPK